MEESELLAKCREAETEVRTVVDCKVEEIKAFLGPGQRLVVSTATEFRVVEESPVLVEVMVKAKMAKQGMKDRPVDNRELTEAEWDKLSKLPLRGAHMGIVNFFLRTGNKPIKDGEFCRLTGACDYYSFNTRLKNELNVLFAVRTVPGCKLYYRDRLVKLYPLK